MIKISLKVKKYPSKVKEMEKKLENNEKELEKYVKMNMNLQMNVL